MKISMVELKLLASHSNLRKWSLDLNFHSDSKDKSGVGIIVD